MTPKQVRAFVFAGNATFTIESLVTRTHYTFHVRKHSNKNYIYWVEMLVAPDTFKYVGMINNGAYTCTHKSANKGANVHNVLRWFFNRLTRELLHEKLVFRHMDTCGRCGRALTTPESIDTGLGPVCADKLGIPHERAA